MQKQLVELLIAKGLHISCAESCTGGLLAGAITSVAGASECLEMAVVTYSNEAKHKLIQVPQELLNTFGAVSYEVAEAMANGIRVLAAADIAVAVTGIAGPGGGSATKPVGLVFIGVATPKGIRVTECRFEGNREQIRSQTVAKALEFAYHTAKEA